MRALLSKITHCVIKKVLKNTSLRQNKNVLENIPGRSTKRGIMDDADAGYAARKLRKASLSYVTKKSDHTDKKNHGRKRKYPETPLPYLLKNSVKLWKKCLSMRT